MSIQNAKEFLDTHSARLPGNELLVFVGGKDKIENLKNYMKTCDSVEKLIDYVIDSKIFCCFGTNPDTQTDKSAEQYWEKLCDAGLGIGEDLVLEAFILQNTQMSRAEIVSAAKRFGKSEQELDDILRNSFWLQYYRI